MADEKDLSDEIARGVEKALAEQQKAVDERKKKQGRQVAIGCGSLVAVPILILTCVAILAEPAGVKITRSEYGEAWPFTIDEGYLDCERGSAVVFRSEGTTYGMNGPGIQTHQPIDPIWRDDPRVAGDPRLRGLKVNVGDLIDRGLELCE